MSRQTGRARILFFTALGALVLLSLGLWMLPETPAPVSPHASVPAEQPERAPDPAPPPTAAPAAPSPGPSSAPLTEPWLRIPSLEKREASEALSPEETRAREIVQGYPAEREAILAELEGQTLEETIALARNVWPSDAFTFPHSRGPFFGDRQKYLLQDPRLARILHAAVHGSEAERNAILHSIMQAVEEMLAERKKRVEGLPYNENAAGAAPGTEIYPLILAEVDEDGTSLPLLVEWYDADRGPVRSVEEIRALHEKMGLEPQPESTLAPRRMGTGAMYGIAAAARRIAGRMGEPLVEGANGPDGAPGHSDNPFPGGRWGVPFVDELRGYALLEELAPYDCDPVMEELWLRLQAPGV